MEIEIELITEIKKTVQLLVEASATLNNSIRTIEREHPYTDEPTLKAAMWDIKEVAGNLSSQWSNVTGIAAEYDISCLISRI